MIVNNKYTLEGKDKCRKNVEMEKRKWRNRGNSKAKDGESAFLLGM
jgi:hypothetical protein